MYGSPKSSRVTVIWEFEKPPMEAARVMSSSLGAGLQAFIAQSSTKRRATGTQSHNALMLKELCFAYSKLQFECNNRIHCSFVTESKIFKMAL